MSNWRRVDPTIDLNDPESRFRFASERADVEVRFRDWQNRAICIRFADVSQFAYSHLPPDPTCPEGEFCYLDSSPLIDRLRQAHVIGRSETEYHYVISSNDEEWCEIVAASHRVTIGD